MSIFGPGIHESVDEFFREKVGGAGHRVPPIRSSAISTYQTCPRKFLYDEKLGLKGRSYEGALFRGDIYHQFRAHLISGVPIEEAAKKVRATLDESRVKLAEQAGSDGRLSGGADLSSVLSKMEDDYRVAQAMAESVQALYPLDPTIWRLATHPKSGESLVEYRYESTYSVGGQEAKIVVRFDRVLEHIPTGEIWLVDDKTTTFDPPLVASSKSYAAQIRLYRAALCEIFPAERVVGTIHTILKVPQIRQKQKESFKEYVGRVREFYAKENENIYQSFVRFDEPVWSGEFNEIIGQQAGVSMWKPLLSDFPRYDGACFKFNRPCTYIHLCNTDPNNWPRLIPLTLDIRFREDEDDKENENG